ncbi:MAG: rhodanese-like domain-containing protein [Thermoanaerobaculia bacterium]
MDMHFEGVVFQTHAAELARRLTRPFPPSALLDVRPAADYARGHIPGARTVTVEEIRRGLPAGVGSSTEVIVSGADHGDRMVREATKALRAAGVHRIVEFPGGLAEWRAAGGAVEEGAAKAA